jgi:hypothetical protein
MTEYTEYLAYGYSGPAASDYCEEIVTAKTPEYAKLCFIRSMKRDKPRWKNMGEDNVHVRLLHEPAKMRDEIPATLIQNWEPDGKTLAEVVAQMKTYDGMIVAAGGISGSGRIDFQDFGINDDFFTITYKRLETDAEYDKRCKDEDEGLRKCLAQLNPYSTKVTASKETKERKEYARLKKKFGDT